MRVTTDPTPRPTTLGAFDLTSGSNPTVWSSEFTYNKRTEIHGEKEPAEYVYQVKGG